MFTLPNNHNSTDLLESYLGWLNQTWCSTTQNSYKSYSKLNLDYYTRTALEVITGTQTSISELHLKIITKKPSLVL